MLRLLICAVAVISAVVAPLEDPAARAEDWQEVKGTEFCVDNDSIKVAGQWSYWTAEVCHSSDPSMNANPQQLRVACNPDLTAADATLYWYDPETSAWREGQYRKDSSAYDMALYICLSS